MIYGNGMLNNKLDWINTNIFFQENAIENIVNKTEAISFKFQYVNPI